MSARVAFSASLTFTPPMTAYETGNILNLEGAVTKNFGPLGVGVVSYAMIQTTGDSGSGARLGSFNLRVYGVGPIVSFTTSADPSKALTASRNGTASSTPSTRSRATRSTSPSASSFDLGLPIWGCPPCPLVTYRINSIMR